ncbi:MAG: Cobalt-zinc-cadmium resistance protein CzcC precursor [Planctomycetota bacterium]|jgi:cobalt-zinc-cadmium efflux system outer membrane protein
MGARGFCLLAVAAGLYAVSGCAMHSLTATPAGSAEPPATRVHAAPASTQSAASTDAGPEASGPIASQPKQRPETAAEIRLTAFADDQAPAAASPATPAPAASGMTLAEIEKLALDNNPTIRQLSASITKARGYRGQVGLKPNPTIGYFGSQIADAGTDQHGAFISQEFVTGGKLDQNRRVLDRTLQAQLWDFETQKQRVLTDVRVQFYEALAAQRRIELTDQFHEVTVKGVEVSRRRREAQETSVVDLLQAEVQMSEIDVARQQARVAFKGAMQQLAAVSGTGELPQQTLSGDLKQPVADMNWDSVLQNLLQSSPELQAARFRVSAAQALQRRQQQQAIPNLQTEFGAGADNATGEGLINVTVGVPVPVFNRNTGNISAAYGEYSRAVHEVSRIEASIKSRLAEARQNFDAAAVAVQQYEDEILPRTAQTLELSERAFSAGEFDFLQVLIVRRTYFESNLKYVDSLAALAQARSQIDGLLLTGALDAPADQSGDDGLRGQTFSQQ